MNELFSGLMKIRMDMDFFQIEQETEKEFELIADKLLNDYAIENHESVYRIIELEFYWTSLKHKDNCTYQRNHVNPRNGDWFFHYSGVDIALKNENSGGYGGILIRCIYSLKEKKSYKGPMVCAMKLFSCTSAFSESIKTRIAEHEFKRAKVIRSARIGLGKNAVESNTDKLNYRFSISLDDQ
jgi:hypothetical protein